MPQRRARLAFAAAPLLLAACSELSSPLSPAAGADGGPSALAAVQCTATLTSRTVRCGDPSAGGARGAVLVGGQNTYVELTSANVAVTADTFAFDVSVANLLDQPMGTADDADLTPDAAGVRVFFDAQPASTSGGTVTVANADGTANFTAAAQPYFQYDEVLLTDSVSAPKRWKLRFSPEVTAFTFTVYVAAEVPYPNGYVDGNPYVLTLNPNETVTVPGQAVSFVGNPIAGASVTYTSNTPSIVSTSGAQATAGGQMGYAELTGASGSIATQFPTAVSVCQASVAANGANIAGEIDFDDCGSSFGDENFRPSSDYFADLYRITLTAGQTLTVVMTGDGELDPQLTLANPLGFPVDYNDDIDYVGGNYDSAISFVVPASGVYVLEASSSFYVPFNTGTYNLTVSITN